MHSAEQRDAEAEDNDVPPPSRRERVTSEAIGFWAASGAAAWATVSEFMAVLPKAVAGTALATAAAISAGKAWRAKRQERRSRNEDR